MGVVPSHVDWCPPAVVCQATALDPTIAETATEPLLPPPGSFPDTHLTKETLAIWSSLGEAPAALLRDSYDHFSISYPNPFLWQLRIHLTAKGLDLMNSRSLKEYAERNSHGPEKTGADINGFFYTPLGGSHLAFFLGLTERHFQGFPRNSRVTYAPAYGFDITSP